MAGRSDRPASGRSSMHSTPTISISERSGRSAARCTLQSADAATRTSRPMAERLSVFADFTLETFADRHHFDPPHRAEPQASAIRCSLFTGPQRSWRPTLTGAHRPRSDRGRTRRGLLGETTRREGCAPNSLALSELRSPQPRIRAIGRKRRGCPAELDRHRDARARRGSAARVCGTLVRSASHFGNGGTKMRDS